MFVQHLLDLGGSVGHIVWLGEEVEVVDGQDEHGRVLQITQPGFIGGGQLAYVFRVHVPFVGAVALGNAAHHNFMVGLQVDDEVGFGDFVTEGGMDTAVHRQFIILQIQPGK